MIINIYTDTPNTLISDKHIVCIVKKKNPVLETATSLLFQLILYWEVNEISDFLWRSCQATEEIAGFYL